VGCIRNNPLDMRQVTADVDAAAPVCVLTWLDNPQVNSCAWVALQVWVRFWVVEGCCEFLKLFTGDTLCYVKSQR